MNKERVKLIVKNIELLIDSLKKELNETETEDVGEQIITTIPYVEDYDEVFSG